MVEINPILQEMVDEINAELGVDAAEEQDEDTRFLSEILKEKGHTAVINAIMINMLQPETEMNILSLYGLFIAGANCYREWLIQEKNVNLRELEGRL